MLLQQSKREAELLVDKVTEQKTTAHWIHRYRIIEAFVLLVLNYFAWTGKIKFSQNQISPPTVSLNVGGTQVTVEDPDHSFPLKVNGQWCYATDFEACSSDDTMSDCCSGEYEQIIGTAGEYYICFLVPLIFLAIRCIVSRFGFKSRNVGYNFLHHFIGLLACWLFVQLSIILPKGMVGYPRPNFYALQAYGNLHDEDYDVEESFISFPSGHSATSMATMLYISLIQFNDLKLVLSRKRVFSSLGWKGFSCFLPVIFSLWIGLTRIIDYFHAPADVLTGFILGAFSGTIAFVCFVPNFLEPRKSVLEVQQAANEDNLSMSS
mmetsp:Transcript_33893/g.44706  ORF Transcript_33893/g.44706 Transcript_33893/m.44706 type:complete len:321 (+) Transcript_33893:86-1048(+)